MKTTFRVLKLDRVTHVIWNKNWFKLVLLIEMGTLIWTGVVQFMELNEQIPCKQLKDGGGA